MIVIINRSKHNGTVFYLTIKILKNLAAEDPYGSDSESDAVGDLTDNIVHLKKYS